MLTYYTHAPTAEEHSCSRRENTKRSTRFKTLPIEKRQHTRAPTPFISAGTNKRPLAFLSSHRQCFAVRERLDSWSPWLGHQKKKEKTSPISTRKISTLGANPFVPEDDDKQSSLNIPC